MGDFTIADNMCKESASGKGYSGILSSTMSDSACLPWTSVPEYYKPVVWMGQDKFATADTMLSSLHNYCRNPDNDAIGPWCFTSMESGRMEYCNIPLCGIYCEILVSMTLEVNFAYILRELVAECRDVEYSCANGRCVSRDLLCNGRDDCGDLSDEIQACSEN